MSSAVQQHMQSAHFAHMLQTSCLCYSIAVFMMHNLHVEPLLPETHVLAMNEDSGLTEEYVGAEPDDKASICKDE